MIDAKRVLGLITARGGSKGVPGKNIRIVRGKPLLAYTIDAAKASRYLDSVVLSTDDDAIAEVGRRSGCDVPFMRPAELATDEASSVDVALHAVEALPGFDLLVLLQPTSPLRSTGDIDGAIECCVARAASACVSVCEAEENPHWMFRVDAAGRLQPLLADVGASRRQDLPRVHVLNGAVYVVAIEALRAHRAFLPPDTVAFEMPRERSLDIDTDADLQALDVALR